MTRPHRRDKDVRSASVITGLRLERDLAQKLCAKARTHARDKSGKGNVAEMARYLIRTGLGYTPEESNHIEETMRKVSVLAGLQLEPMISEKLRQNRTVDREWNALGISGRARHLMRVGLGISIEESLMREERFAALAAAKREIMEAG